MVHNLIKKYISKYSNESDINEAILIDEFSNEQMGRVFSLDGNKLQENFEEGDFVRIDQEQRLIVVNDSAVAVELNEINNTLRQNIQVLEESSLPIEYPDSKNVHSYHVNVGHGNCSIVVFQDNSQNIAWMVDCSSYDFMNGKNYLDNLEQCLEYIKIEHGISRISKTFISHPHFDHINGLQYLLDKKIISGKYTEVWLNYQYHWGSKTYNSVLARMKADNFKFILPICKNSTSNIEILFPEKNLCNPKYMKRGCSKPANNKVNNASVIYKFNLGNKSMVFPGDLEIGGWHQVNNHWSSKMYYYCISHHGSKNGICPIWPIENEIDRLDIKVLMGRDVAYTGIFCGEVKREIGHNIYSTDNANLAFLEIDWKKNIVIEHP